jgi:isoleucyl-tRNA synthetase
MTSETTLELKKTVNLPQTNFAQKANLGQAEPARLQKWAAMDLYGLICQSRAGRKRFILHDGPPYANADIHLGTARNKILKDFIVKSRSMLGYDAPYVPGYDCHGLPIEKKVELQLEAKGKKKSDLPPAVFRRICRDYAADTLQRMNRDFQRLGIFGEWDNPYLTMSHEYEAETARLFGRFVERGYAYKGLRPVYWCIHDQTALAEAEVEYKQHASPSVYVKFPLASAPELVHKNLAGRRVSVVIWTTTPWTLPANLGIAFHPDYEYSALEAGDEVYIVASELAANFAETCGLGAVNTLARFAGKKLDRLECRHAWLDRPSLLMCGEHVTLGGEADAETELDVDAGRDKRETGKAGTGCVHTAPGHGHDDFIIGKKYGLEIYCPVDNAGRFTSEVEHFAGLSVFEANPKIVEFMQDKGLLLHSENYEHRYPCCWRCKNPVIFRATPQWFISLDKVAQLAEDTDLDDDGRAIPDFENEENLPESLRRAALRETGRVRWLPAWGEARMSNMLRGRPDWCVSRQRVWGVPIPAFYCASCGETIASQTAINHVADIFAQETADAWYAREAKDLLPDGFVCPHCGGAEFTKETDILDVWFDSGSSCVAVLDTRPNLRYPADVYIEGADQFRGWFNSSLFCGLAAHDAAPYRTVLTHGWVMLGDSKMSKSQGNALSPNEVVKRLGAEIVRLWAAGVDYMEDARCSDEILERTADAYRKIRNTARYALGNLNGFTPGQDDVAEDQMHELDRWALAELDDVVKKVVKHYERYEYLPIYHALYNFCTVTLSARYFDIIKDRLYTAAPRSRARRSAQTALYRIADALARLLAPILVFTADEIWENLPGVALPSVHLAEFPAAQDKEDFALQKNWERLFAVRDEVLKELEAARAAKIIGSSLEARVELAADGATYDLLRQYADELRYLFIVSQVTLAPDAAGTGLSVKIARADGQKCERCWNYSTRVGEAERYPTACERCIEALAEIEK